MNSRLAKAVVIAIVGVWTVTTVVLPILIHGYSPPPEIGPVMGAVGGAAAAALFARSEEESRRRQKKRRQHHENDPPKRKDEEIEDTDPGHRPPE